MGTRGLICGPWAALGTVSAAPGRMPALRASRLRKEVSFSALRDTYSPWENASQASAENDTRSRWAPPTPSEIARQRPVRAIEHRHWSVEDPGEGSVVHDLGGRAELGHPAVLHGADVVGVAGGEVDVV